MPYTRIFAEDLEIAYAILHRNEAVTKRYLYQQCYPLFKRYFDGYYTDCESCKEFIDEIYLIIMTPSQKNGQCPLMNFRGESTLARWLKTICQYYCYDAFNQKEPNSKTNFEQKVHDSDRFLTQELTIEFDFGPIYRKDVETIIDMMPNKRYGVLMRLRYLEHLSNSETAEAMGLTKANYDNVHSRARKQFENVLKKEGVI